MDKEINNKKKDNKHEKYGDIIIRTLKISNTKENEAISGRNLSLICGISQRDLRREIHILRMNGIPVCSSPKGYWYSTDRKDIDKTISQLKGWMVGLEDAVNSLEAAKNSK